MGKLLLILGIAVIAGAFFYLGTDWGLNNCDKKEDYD